MLLFASQILTYLGYKKIFILGCDLTYDPNEKYAYTMDSTDLEHEKNSLTIKKRLNIPNGDKEFSILQDHLKCHGVTLYNVGIGGNLNSIHRIDLAESLELYG